MVPASFDQRAHAVLCFVELAQRPLLADHLVWDFCGRADPLPRELTIDQLNHAHRKAIDVNLLVISTEISVYHHATMYQMTL
jgi:hypothetical protein